MTKTDIKKALYKEKPKAKELGIFGDVGEMFWVYRAKLNSVVVYFEVPEEERTWHTTNSDNISAQLLIRWMV